MSKSPAFQWYAADYLADERVAQLPLEAEGAYVRLLSYCWREGSIPASLSLLPPLCKYADAKVIKLALALFTKTGAPPGRLIHKRLEEEREKQDAFKSKQADNGRLGGRPKKANPNPDETQKKGLGFFGETQMKPKKRSSTSSSISSSSSESSRSSLSSGEQASVNLAEMLAEEVEPWLAPLPESPADDASHTEGDASDVGTSLVPERGGRWNYEPAAIAESLVMPFESADFRQAWVAYRTFREEDKQRQLTGGMQEQELLRKLSTLAGGNQQKAIAIIAQTIAKGWKDLYKLDEPRTSTQQPAPGQSGGGQKPTLNAVAMAGTLASRRFNQPGGSASDIGQAAGANPGQGAGGASGFGAH